MKAYEVPSAQVIDMLVCNNVAQDITISSSSTTTEGGDKTWTRHLDFDDEVSDFEE